MTDHPDRSAALLPLRARGPHVGLDYFTREHGVPVHAPSHEPLIPDFAIYRRSGFDPDVLHPIVRDFYADPERFIVLAQIRWRPLIRPLGLLYTWLFARPFDQLDPLPDRPVVPRGVHCEVGHVELSGVAQKIRYWVRSWRSADLSGTFYVATFHTFRARNSREAEEGLMAVTFPFPWSNLSAVFLPEHLPDGGMRLESRPPVRGVAGHRMVVPIGDRLLAIRLPFLREAFDFTVDTHDGKPFLRTHHHEDLLGLRAFDAHYVIWDPAVHGTQDLRVPMLT